MKHRTFYISLIAIMLVGTSSRIPGIFTKALCYWDEGIFAMGSEFLNWRVPVVMKELGCHLGFECDLPDPESYPGYPVYLQKPFHVILLTLTSQFTGFKSWAGPIHSVVFGLGTILLTALIGRKVFDPATGLIAAGILALEPFHVHYSRLGLHETDSMFLILLCFGLWMHSLERPGKRWSFLVGLTAILAIGTSYRLLIMITMIFLFEVAGSFIFKRSKKTAVMRYVCILCGAAAAFLFLELSYYLIFNPHYLWSQPASYLSILKKKVISQESRMDLMFPFFYVKMFSSFDGWFPSAMTATGLVYLSLRKKFRGICTAFMFIIPFAVFSFTTTRLARTCTGLLPFGALASGLLLAEISRIAVKGSRISFKWLSTAILFSMGCVFIMNLLPIYRIDSGYPEIADFLRANDETGCLTTMKPIMAFYMDRKTVLDPGKTFQEMCINATNSGARYLCVDWQEFVGYGDMVRYNDYEKYREMMQAIHTFKPVFSVKNPVVEYFATLHENYLPMDVPLLPRLYPRIYEIRVYDLTEILPLVNCPLTQNITRNRDSVW
ncbi:glycosyltransferase family 39 protein [bacterium]|nr:glycosyltransferase family 39 protein [candidate division CSSED10-310 bacterium]